MNINSTHRQLLFSTVRIETESSDGSGIGTAFQFVYKVPNVEDAYFSCLVTNKHVVEGSEVGSFFFFTKTVADDELMLTSIGDPVSIRMEQFQDLWTGHPDPEVDIAIMPTAPILAKVKEVYGVETCLIPLRDDLIPEGPALDLIDVVEDVLIVGYPDGRFDTVNRTPIIRKGSTATPIQLDFGGRPVFLIDASIFPGSSGSPVVIVDYAKKRFFFLGVVAEVEVRDELSKVEFVDIPVRTAAVVKTQEMLDLGVVFKAHTVVETIEYFNYLLQKHKRDSSEKPEVDSVSTQGSE